MLLGPFLFLPKFLSHEQQLFARMRPLVGVQCAKRGHFLPLITGHLRNERAFAVNDLIMGQRQNVVLGECVHQREREFTVVPATVDRVFLHVPQRVVHPAHIPLHAEPQAAS